MTTPKIVSALFPDLLWHANEFKPNFGVLISDAGILAVAPHSELRELMDKKRDQGDYITYRRLPDRALLPGFVNTHSHAFQRAIRGRTEFPGVRKDGTESFWSWRDSMYSAASKLDPTDLEAISQAVFVEMVKSGITRVGEFHYLHHQPNGSPYPDPDELTNRVLSGARSAGLKVTLLRAFYERAGVGRPSPEGAQKIFCDPSLEYYLETLERLRQRNLDIGVTAHSVRAVTKSGLEALSNFAQTHALPFHIHVSEQKKEIEECLSEYQCRPVELLADVGALTSKTTLVHAIHLSDREIEAIGKGNCFIASCPTTERNLGDGVVPAAPLLRSGAKFTFGSDSQCQISLPEDARQLEYHLRLQGEVRSLLYPTNLEAGREMLSMLTSQGAASLGATDEGVVREGAASDLIAIDLNHLCLAGASAQSLPLDIIFSLENSAVTDVWVDGTEIVSQGYHRAEKQAQQNLRRVMTKLRNR